MKAPGESDSRTSVLNSKPVLSKLAPVNPADSVEGRVRYLTGVSEEVGVADPVGDRFAAVVGRSDALHVAAETWRRSADVLEGATRDVDGTLGGIDSAWRGVDADAFLTHMQEVGLAGNDVVDAIRAWADALDRAAEALRVVGEKFADHVAETAENVSTAVVSGGEQGRVRRLLLDAEDPARELVRSAENVVRDFVRFCDEFDPGRGVSEQTPCRSEPQHAYGSPAPQPAFARQEGASGSEAVSASTGSGAPSVGGADGASPVDAESSCSQLAVDERSSPEEVPESPVPAAAAGTGHAGSAAAAVGGTWGGGMVGAMPMAGMMGRNQESPRQNASRLKASPEDLFGKPAHTAPAIFGAPQKRPLE